MQSAIPITSPLWKHVSFSWLANSKDITMYIEGMSASTVSLVPFQMRHKILWTTLDEHNTYGWQSLWDLTSGSVAVSRGYDTCFSVKACDGLYQLIKSIGSDWNTIWVSIDRVDLCQAHCNQVPDFSRPSGSDQVTWAKIIWFIVTLGLSQLKQVNTHGSPQFPPSDQYGLCFGYCFSGPLPLRSHYNRLPFVESVSGSP